MSTDELISCIFIKNALWDQKDPQHHNRFILDKLWDEIAEEMKSTRSVVRAKWKTLLDSFRRELAKLPIKRSGDGASQLMKSSWQYFDSLSFLKDQFTPRPSGGNLPDIGNKNTCLLEDADTEVTEVNEQDADEPIGDNQSVLEDKTASHTDTRTIPRGLKRKRQNNADINATLIRIEESKLKILENQQTKATPTDEDTSFFDSL